MEKHKEAKGGGRCISKAGIVVSFVCVCFLFEDG